MDRYIQRFLNRISVIFTTIATLSLLHLFLHSSLSCSPPPYSSSSSSFHPHHHTLTLTPFPHSSCDLSSSRPLLTPERRFLKLRLSRPFRLRVASFSALFSHLRSLSLLSNSSRVLCVSAGAGHEVAALQESGVADVTGVELVDFPPLVRRSDPHNLPFFDSVFDLGFSAGLGGALFPVRFVGELERTVRRGGVVVLEVDRCRSEQEVEGVKGLFRRSSVLEVRNVTMGGSEMSLFIMRNNGNPP